MHIRTLQHWWKTFRTQSGTQCRYSNIPNRFDWKKNIIWFITTERKIGLVIYQEPFLNLGDVPDSWYGYQEPQMVPACSHWPYVDPPTICQAPQNIGRNFKMLFFSSKCFKNFRNFAKTFSKMFPKKRRKINSKIPQYTEKHQEIW